MVQPNGAQDGASRDGGSPAGRTRGLVVGAGIGAVGAVLAFLYLDPIVAAFLAIIALTLATVAWLARDWDRHSTFEERELDRARKRAVRRERTKDVRARDRARWEAHQARQAAKQQKEADG